MISEWRSRPLGVLMALAVALSFGTSCGVPPLPPTPALATRASPAATRPAGPPVEGEQASGTAMVPEPVPVRLAIFGTLTDAGLFVALARGYFRAEGLAVETVPSDSSLQITPLLATGQIDVAGTSQSPALFNAALRGVPYRLVADKGRVTPGHDAAAVVLRPDLVESGRVRDYADLRGLLLNTPGLGTASWGLLQRALAIGGVVEGEVEQTTLLQPDVLPALGNGVLDGALLTEPFVSAAVARRVGLRWRGAVAFARDAQTGLVAYSPQFAALRAPAQRFMAAYLRGLRDYLDAVRSGRHEGAIIDILIQYTAVKDRAAYATIRPTGFDANGRINVAYLSSEQDLYRRAGLMTEAVDIPSLVDHQYVEYAVERLGRR